MLFPRLCRGVREPRIRAKSEICTAAVQLVVFYHSTKSMCGMKRWRFKKRIEPVQIVREIAQPARFPLLSRAQIEGKQLTRALKTKRTGNQKFHLPQQLSMRGSMQVDCKNVEKTFTKSTHFVISKLMAFFQHEWIISTSFSSSTGCSVNTSGGTISI